MSVLGEDYGWYGGKTRRVSNSTVLPPQAIPKSKKNDKWNKHCLDNLEAEGLKQYISNLPMSDYYKMISGEMVYSDIQSEDDLNALSRYLNKTKKDLNIPSYLQHWDLMYPVVSKIVGDFMIRNDKLRFDTTDDTSTNDYIRERTFRLAKYSEAVFKSELNKFMTLEGINLTDPANEEEAKQQQAELDKIKSENFPEKIDDDMRKNWKSEAANWAKKTNQRDYERFRMSVLESLEAKDILLTGKSFRNYRLGYDYYYPEHWHPIECFHSKDASITRIEDCEFAGRIKFYSLSDLMTTYGDSLSEKQRISIYKLYYGEDYIDYYSSSPQPEGNAMALFGEGSFDRKNVPFKGFGDHMMALEYEDIMGIPQSIETDVATGETREVFTPRYGSNIVSYGSRISRILRHDIEVRTDTMQVTEAYWRGSKKLGLMTYREKSGYLNTVEVDEDLLSDVKSHYGIKTIRDMSLVEYNALSDDKKENTVVWVDTDAVYKGVKIAVSTPEYNDGIYLVEEMPVQIKGDKGNVFSVKLPLCGHIGESLCKKIRPEQITYNYLRNQSQSYLEKEIGAFFVLDVNSIPSDHFDLGDDEDVLYNLRNIAKQTGLLPTDLGRNNLNQNGGGLMFNPMSYQNATFTDQLMRNEQLAEKIKWQAYDRLGLTPQAMGSPSQYSTAEGIQVGQNSTFAQSYDINQILLENKRSNTEIHMSIAQYAVLNNKDVNYIYSASDNEIEFIQSIKDDDTFSLRKIDVRPIYDAKRNMEFEKIKQMLVSNNTMGADAKGLVDLVLSDDFMELKESALKARMYADKVRQESAQSQQDMQQQQIQANMKMHDDEISVKREKNQAMVKVAELSAIGRTADNTNQGDGVDVIQKNAALYLKDKQIDMNTKLSLDKARQDYMVASSKVNQKAQEIDLARQRFELDREKLNTMRYVADAKNRDSVINKN